MISIKPALSAQDIAECFRIRVDVFVTEQGVPEEEEGDAYDEHALHFLAWREGEAIGTARVVLLEEGRLGKIGRVAVDHTQRGLGVGAALIEAVEAAVKVERFQLDAQVDAMGFYERLGYVAEGEAFLDAGILHRRMGKVVR
jgi:predicted GNAT family N-acyltransferase